MARKKVMGSSFESWDEVDTALKQIGEIDRELSMIEAAQNEQIDQVKTQAKSTMAPLADRKAGLELAIRDYAEANRAEFASVKTKILTFGSVGFRLSTKVLVKRVGDTLQSLKDLGLSACIRVKEEIDKEAMKNLDKETLANVGAALKSENVFGYEINLEKLAGF